MRKSIPFLSVALAFFIVVSGCQGVSAGLSQKTSSCSEILSNCTSGILRPATEAAKEIPGEQQECSCSGPFDLLKSLPFATMVH